MNKGLQEKQWPTYCCGDRLLPCKRCKNDTWKSKMNQQFRRAQKKGICSPLKEGSCP
jgi:hypothetical protein